MILFARDILSLSKDHMKWIFVVIIMITAFCVPGLSHASHYEPNHCRTIETEHFSFHYQADPAKPAENAEPLAQKVAGLSESVYKELSEKFDARPWGRT